MSRVYDILEMTGFEQLSKADRWALIDQLDQHTDALQAWRTMLPPTSTASINMAQLLVRIRLKRFTIWQTFYPAIGHKAQLAA